MTAAMVEDHRLNSLSVLPSLFMKPVFFLIVILLIACSYKTDIPLEYPTPPPPPAATPLPKLELRRDSELEKQFVEIAKDAKGKVGVAAVVLEMGDAALLNADGQYPMQSVYKLPISMAVMDQVRLGNLALDEQVAVTPDDFVRPGQASPLRDKNPKGGLFTIRELIRLALVESDGTASDVLLRVLGGPDEAQRFLASAFVGVGKETIISNTEKELGQDWNVQYSNPTTPNNAIEFLRFIFQRGSKSNSDQVEDDGDALILKDLIDCVTGPNRLKGLLPKATMVAHKTGTSGTRDGITAATNDIGIVYLPNGKHLAIAVFVSDSPADEKTREAVIAHMAKAAWDHWSH
jgi:beta-lactamase class A